MAGSKRNKLGLTIDSTPRMHRKYLGDPNDPHYVPDSPLIERKHLSEQDEAELKRCCTLALARVPHSDDTPEDPLKYLGPHVHRKSTASALGPRPQTATQSKATKAAHSKRQPPPQPPQVSQVPQVPQIPASAGSSNSSEADRTDYSTPLTSAGITPCEVNKRFSDALRRPSNSTSAGSKNKTASKSKSGTASTSQRKSKTHKSNDSPTENSAANTQVAPLSRDYTCWPCTTAPVQSSASLGLLSEFELEKAPVQSSASLGLLSEFELEKVPVQSSASLGLLSEFELEKQLPPAPWPPKTAPPRTATAPRPKSMHTSVPASTTAPALISTATPKPSINRLFKSVKKAKSSTALAPSRSMSEQPPVPALPEISALKKAATDLPTNARAQLPQPPPAPPSETANPKQRRFRFSRFFPLRKESSTPVAT